ncbi:MAG: SMP-30/gluconolactonase/LRE family protein, partial [Rhodospirillaceae bacterium]|nr:SMP-30/gluconolactonase/LRE family protein [Rhodospirillaceae bacterium]
DMYLPAIYRYRPDSGENERLPLADVSQIGVLIQRCNGGFVLGVPDGLALLDPVNGELTPLTDPREDRDGVFFNDAKADRQGRLWINTYHVSETKPVSTLYRVDPDGTATVAAGGMMLANGPAFAPDGSVLYLADSTAGMIYSYDMDSASGALGPQELFAEIWPDAGIPDGMTVDSEGGLWNAHYEAARLTRYLPDGEVDLTVTLPVPNVTSCMFGGPDLATLYVTSATSGLSASELADAPLSGGLFAIETGFNGLPEPEFAG